MGLQIQTGTTGGIIKNCSPRTERVQQEQRPQEHLLSAEWRDQGQPFLKQGQSSQLNTLHKEVADWVAFSNKTYNKASPETLPGMVLKTSYRRLLQSLHQEEAHRDLTAEVTTEDVLKTFESWHCDDCWTWDEGQTCIQDQKLLECDRIVQHRTVTSSADSSSSLKSLGLYL